MGYTFTYLAPSYWESVYYGYMALSSIGVESTVPHTPAAVAYVSYYVLAGLGLLTPVWKSTSASAVTPSNRRRVDGVDVDAKIQRERAIILISTQVV